MQWSTNENAGFTKGKPWLPVSPTYTTHNVASELKDPSSILQTYRQLLALRHKNSALLDGEYIALNESDPKILSYLRRYKNEAVLVVLNMSGEKQDVSFDLAAQGFTTKSSHTLLNTSGKNSGEGSLSHVSLEPFAAYVGSVSK